MVDFGNGQNPTRTKPHWDKTPLDKTPLGQTPHWDKTPLSNGVLSQWGFILVGFCPVGFCPIGVLSYNDLQWEKWKLAISAVLLGIFDIFTRIFTFCVFPNQRCHKRCFI